MLYAANVADMLKDYILAEFLLAPHKGEIVNCEVDRTDGSGMMLTCGEEVWEGIVYVVRRKYPKHSFRLYESKTGRSWTRV